MRQVSTQAVLAFRGDSSSAPTGHAGPHARFGTGFGSSTVDIVSAGVLVVGHHLRASDAGMLVSTDEHLTALSAMWRPFPTVVDEVDAVDFQHDFAGSGRRLPSRRAVAPVRLLPRW
jgi:hypothetical protein